MIRDWTEDTMQTTSDHLAFTACASERELLRELVSIGKRMYRMGYAPGTSGNISVRLDSQRILATPTGCGKSLMRPSDMVVVDPDGHKLCGKHNPTSELGMHLTVYRMRPDVQAIVHAHPPIATAFAACRKALDEPICSEILMTTGPVPLAAYATTGTEEVSASLEPFIPMYDAILLANHGVLTYGGSLLDAFMKMETTEHFAQVCLAAHQLGGARALSSVDIEKLHHARGRYRQNSGEACRY
ncbi:MAG TPA: class II aldolase/adducin family protein [Acidisarcina sp.]|nr:class II aldolase/adducin family protein [Acidisarcina sp.]